MDLDGRQIAKPLIPHSSNPNGKALSYLNNHYQKSESLATMVELGTSFVGIAITSLAVLYDRKLNNSKKYREALTLQMEVSTFFYTLQINIKESGFFDTNNDNIYSDTEVEAVMSYIESSMVLNYNYEGVFDSIKPYSIFIPSLSKPELEYFLNYEEKYKKENTRSTPPINFYSPKGRLQVLNFEYQMYLRSIENEK